MGKKLVCGCGAATEDKKLSKVKLNIDGLDPDGLTGKGDAVSKAMTGNANFPDAGALLTKLGTDNAAAKAKVIVQKNAAKAATQATLDRDVSLAAVSQDLVDIGGHVQSASHGDPVVIESASLDVASSTHNPVGKLGQVQNLSLTTGDNPGEVDAHWDTCARNTFEQQLCTGDPTVEANWKHAGTSGASKTTFSGQASGSRLWSRVRANASKPENNGPWSQPATIIVP